MPVQLIPIRSHDASHACTCPWVEMSVDPTTLSFTITVCKGYPALVGQHRFTLDPARSTEEHVLAITLEGELEFVPFSRQRTVYYAHLAWIDPTTRNARMLSFIPRTDND